MPIVLIDFVFRGYPLSFSSPLHSTSAYWVVQDDLPLWYIFLDIHITTILFLPWCWFLWLWWAMIFSMVGEGGGLSHSPPTPLLSKKTYTSGTVLTFDQWKGCILKHINNISNQYFDHSLATVCDVVNLKSLIQPEPWALYKTLNTSYK